MITDLAELVSRFIQLNRDLTHGYIDLAEYLDTYTALDLLSHKEFQPILLALAAIGVDLFFTLTVIVGLYRRLDKSQFTSLSGHLDLVDNRIILRSSTYAESIRDFQNCADRIAARSVEISSFYYQDGSYRATDFVVN